MARPGTPVPGCGMGKGEGGGGHHAEKWALESADHDGCVSLESEVGDGGGGVPDAEGSVLANEHGVAPNHSVGLDPRGTALALDRNQEADRRIGCGVEGNESGRRRGRE